MSFLKKNISETKFGEPTRSFKDVAFFVAMLCHDLGGYQNIWNPTMSLHSLTTQKAMI
jgi:hypothetical protein